MAQAFILCAYGTSRSSKETSSQRGMQIVTEKKNIPGLGTLRLASSEKYAYELQPE